MVFSNDSAYRTVYKIPYPFQWKLRGIIYRVFGKKHVVAKQYVVDLHSENKYFLSDIDAVTKERLRTMGIKYWNSKRSFHWNEHHIYILNKKHESMFLLTFR